MTRVVRNARLLADPRPADRVVSGQGPDLDADGGWLVPSFVDLCCDPGFPGFPVRGDRASLEASARAGGFADLVASPAVDPVVDTPEQVAGDPAPAGVGAQPDRVRLHPSGALTLGLDGKELAEIGLLVRAGAVLSDGGRPIRDTAVLRNALEYARAFGAPVLLRPSDPDLDVLGVVNDAPLAALLGLRGNPPAAEEIGVGRCLALVRATGCPVHLTHIGTARGADMIRAAQADGLPVTASTPARNLLLCEDDLDDGHYDTRLRLHPPLRGRADRDALVAAVRKGVLCLCADHQPRAPEEKELEFERASPGSPGLASAFGAALTALGDLGAVVRALAVAPRAVLGRDLPGLTVVHTDDTGWPDASARMDALHATPLRGRVRECLPDARLLPVP
jgi:dihydroorotase